MFVAIVPPEEAVEHLDEFLDVRRESGSFRWTPAEQFHFTLAFCAAVPGGKSDDFVDRLERAAAKRTSFELRISGGGAFPDPASARVLWAGAQTDDAGRSELERAAAGARTAAATAGIEVDGRRFAPHLTVARLGRPTEMSNWVRLLEAYEGPSWRADRVTLIESHLGEGPRRRPRYEVVEEFAIHTRP